MNSSEIKEKTLGAIQIGSVFYINRDAYSFGEREQKSVYQRKVIGLYPNFVLTENSLGIRETFQHYDVLKLIGGIDNG